MTWSLFHCYFVSVLKMPSPGPVVGPLQEGLPVPDPKRNMQQEPNSINTRKFILWVRYPYKYIYLTYEEAKLTFWYESSIEVMIAETSNEEIGYFS